MSRHLYRIVFNRALGLFQEVADIVPIRGSRAVVGPKPAGRPLIATLRSVYVALFLVGGQAVITPLAGAQIVADPHAPGHQRPTVLEAANGVPLVNIQTPGAAGVSRNTYRQFDVDSQGAILNNARTNIQTQQGGWVQGNPWLAKGPARIILNEVNASNPSRLNGFVEVAGERAQLVIANPAGIACDGCGFINANRATLTTGTPIITDGALQGYRVHGGAIQIQSEGLNAGSTDYTALIARSVEVNAGLWAQQLQVTTGTNEVGVDPDNVQQRQANGNAPAFALDVGALGGMYAQKIVMLGTEHGVGVRNAGHLGAQAGQLAVTIDGRLENAGAMQASTDTHLVATGGVANAGTLSAGRELTVSTPNDIDNSKGTINGRRLEVNAQSLVNRGGAIEQTGTQDLALRTAHLANRDSGRIGLVTIDAGVQPGSGDRSGNGGNNAAENPAGEGDGNGGTGMTIGSSVAPLASGTLNITSTLNNDGGRILGGGAIDVTAAAGLDNDGGHLGVRQLDVSGGDLGNRKGELKVSGHARIQTGQLTNDAGQMQLGGKLILNAHDFSNRAGTFQHSDLQDTQLQIQGSLDNSGGTLASNANWLTVDAGQMVNISGQLIHAGEGGFAVNTGVFSGEGGEMVTAGEAMLRMGATDHRKATLTAKQVDLVAQTFDNRGGIVNAAGKLSVTSAQSLDNRDGRLVSAGDMRVRADTLDNAAGQLFSTDGRLIVDTQGRTDNAGGTLQGNGDVSIASAGLGNAGGIVQGANVSVDARHASLDNNGGTLASTTGTLVVDSSTLNNSSGLLQSATALRVNTHGHALVNTHSGVTGGIVSGTTLTLDTGDLDNHAGVIHGQADVTARTGVLDNTAGQFGGRTHIHLDAAALRNGSGQLQAGHNLIIGASGTVNNSGGLMVAGNALALTAGQILNRDTLGTHAGEALGLHGESVTLSARHVDNTASTLAADRHIGIHGVGAESVLDNTGGSVSSGGTLEVAANRVLNPAGTLLAGQSLALTADHLSGDGRVLSHGDLTLALQQDFTHDGEITANHRAAIHTAGRLTNRSLLQAGDLDVRGTHIDNTATGQISGGRTTVVASHALTNRGLIDGSRTYLDASVLDNTGTGRLYGDHLAVRAETVENRDESGHAAVIAARERLDIGASVIHNREQALIFSAGSGPDALNIGGDLDANHHADGRADEVLNDSATIESLGGLTIDTSRLLNRNLHFSTAVAQVGTPTTHLYLQPEGDPNRHDASDYRWENWSRAGRYRHKETGKEARKWTQYQVTRAEYESQVATSAPALIRAGGDITLHGDGFVNDKSQIIAGGALLGDLDHLKNEAAFGEHLTRESGTSQFTFSKWRGGFKRYHERKWDNKIAYTPADTVRTIDLNVARVESHAAGAGNGVAIDGRSPGKLGGMVAGNQRASSDGASRPIVEVPANVDSSSALGSQAAAAVTDDALASGPGAAEGSIVDHVAGNAPTRIRTMQVVTDIPVNSLFRASPAAGNYLVETDPRFTSYRLWLSSDYMLTLLGYDPTSVHKRLGDGFYEQRLVRDQITQLTGRRFLGNYASDEAQYRALLDAGASYARVWDLRPGVALSMEQMAQLTSDIVWLVERDVTLADGTASRALVPQVYVRVKPGDLDGNGTLIAADSVELQFKGDLINTGTVAGRTVVKLTGDNLRNLGGRITGDALALNARTDIDTIGGTLDASSAMILKAGRDLNVTSTTRSDVRQAGLSDFSRTNMDRVAGLYVTNPGGTLVAMAGRDANLLAAQVINAGEDGQSALVAGRDLNLGTVILAEQENNVRNASNYLKQGHMRDIGTTVQTQGDVRLQAGGNINARAASVTSEQGALTAMAAGDVNILAGEASSNWSEGRKHTSRGLLGATTKTTRDSLEENRAVASTFSGNTVAVQGRNVNVAGSNVVSDAGTAMVASNDLTIGAATEAISESHFKRTDKSGLLSGGGVGFTIGTQMLSNDQKTTQTFAAGSTVASVAGNVTLLAGNQYRQVGSDVLAPEGDVSVLARNIVIEEARESLRADEETRFKQSGLSVSLSSPVIGYVQSTRDLVGAVGKADGGRMKALGAAMAALNAKDAYDATREVVDPPKDADGKPTQPGIGINVALGKAESTSRSTTVSDTARGSSVSAGGNVTLMATGAGEDSNIRVRGSEITAGHNATLMADNRIDLLAAENRSEQHSAQRNSSGSVGVGINFGGDQNGVAITAAVSRGRGSSDGEDRWHTDSRVRAGNTATLVSGGDTNLRGAQVAGHTVVADVAGELNIESLQDTSRYASRQSSAGAGISVCVPPICAGTPVKGSVNIARSRASNRYDSVNEQAGIVAGDGGFDIRVKGNTDLKGGLIASSQAAVDAQRNRLVTATLTTSDLENRAEASASSSGIGLSTDMFTQGKYGLAKAAIGNALNNGGAGDASGGVTRSAVSAGAVQITDAVRQRELTGLDASDAVAALNRDTLHAHQAASRLDVGALEAQAEAAQTIKNATVQQVFKFSDDAYKTMFVDEHPMFIVERDEDGKIARDEHGDVKHHRLTSEEAKNLQPNSAGNVYVAMNGIFNDEAAAGNYAAQHHGDREGPLHFLHFPRAGNGLSELMVAGYQNFLENDFFGLTNSGRDADNLQTIYGATGLVLYTHSRAAMTLGNSMESRQRRGAVGSLSATQIYFYGPAYNAQKAANLLFSLSDGKQDTVYLQNHRDDFVGSLIGMNPSTYDKRPEHSHKLFEWVNMFRPSPTVHGCYGKSSEQCQGDYGSPKTMPIKAEGRK
ncbi:two-partner secretion domain-containing protein [Paraburkholderia megapolitana]|uniref:two-partner secretion domain-containing protein n=1 Tax=Paraburkholderia megapolitana TaxID=420953 RepID=UPI0038BD06A2